MPSWSEVVQGWGSTEAERSEAFPCDEVLPGAPEQLYRAVTIAAPAAVVFRWLCQLRAAPYSYDLIDNLGRRSPRRLTPGLERLERGQRFMTIFRLVDFEPGRSITVLSKGSVFGTVVCSYIVREDGHGSSRLLVKLRLGYPRSWPARPVVGALLPAGDLIMMRRQLLNLKGLAERQAAG